MRKKTNYTLQEMWKNISKPSKKKKASKKKENKEKVEILSLDELNK